MTILIGDWYCERCQELIKNKLNFDDVRCSFCPELKGVIKKTGNGNFPWVEKYLKNENNYK